MLLNLIDRIIKKASIFLSILIVPLIGFSQTSANVIDAFTFKLVDSTQDTKANLYTRARQFIALEFSSAKEVIQMDDKESGKIIGKGIFLTTQKLALGIPKQSIVRFTVTIDVKDNKYRCIINDVYHDGFSEDPDGAIGGDLYKEKPDHGLYKKWWGRLKTDVSKEANDFLIRFDKAMREKNASDNF